MKMRSMFLGGLLAAFVPAVALADYRIAYSGDGNQHDADDWHASPMVLAMLAESGNKHRLVHFDYNNHLGDNDSWRAGEHHQAVQQAAQRYGYDSSIIYNDQWNLSGAVNSIARAINASSADDRLYLVCAGPMEVCWRGINAAQDWKEQYVTVISHSRWNDTHSDTWQLRHTWGDIQRDFNVLTDHIQDQNYTAFRSDPWAWNWLKWQNHGDWLYSAIAEGRKAGDASDAGMVYYVIDGRSGSSEWPSMNDIKAKFQGGGDSGGGSADTDSGSEPGNGVLKARNSKKCAEVANWSQSNGGNVRQWNCTGWANQTWSAESISGAVIALRNQHSGKCLEVDGWKNWNGANVQQRWCQKGENQQFTKEYMGDGWFRLRARHSGKCLTVADGSSWNGANIQQWTCHGGWNQQFKVE